ncbi:MAG: TauD/TfdA family dioxygenase [Alphaproteobacteria bacterium]
MPFHPAERVREPALPMQPLVDPAGWTARDLAANEDWIYELSETEVDEVRQSVAAVQRGGLDILDVTRETFPMPRFDAGLHALYDELLEGRGFVLIRGLPIEEFDNTQAGIAFWGIGTRFGRALSQNPKGHMLGHVKDFGGDYADANVRGYQTSAEMAFHSDQCDYVALLCIQPAMSGGASRIVSTVNLYNEMLKTSPELAQALIADFYLTKHGEVSSGEAPWYKMPLFSFHEGYFTARGAGAHIRKAQLLPGVPPFTETQTAALDAYQAVARRVYFDIEFRPGDIQLLHNHVMLHTRTEFKDWPEPGRKRHLMRLWLAEDKGGRPVVPGFRENIQGIMPHETVPCAPVDALEPA